ncbi:hypothetical protein JG688_00018719, partial [Phytophthora aleatoria]
ALVSIAAQRGHLEIVRWIVEWTLPNHTAVEHGILVLAVATLSIHTAATHGHLQVAKYLRETASRSVCGGYTAHFTGQEIESLRGVIVEASPEAQRVSGRTMILAAKKGFLNVIQWLYAEYGDDLETEIFNVGPERLPIDTVAMDTAASYGHLDVLKYFHELQTSGETRLQCTKNAMDRAAEREGCTTAAMDKAAACGHLEVVKWLHQHRTEGCTQAAMDEAALPKRIEVVQWLHENRAEGCSTRAMDNAAMTGHLDMVKWLHVHRTEGCTERAMNEAAENGHLKVVQWLYANRSETCTSSAVDYAAACNEFEVVLYLHFQCRVDCTDVAAFETLESDHPEMHAWVLEHYPAFRDIVMED